MAIYGLADRTAGMEEIMRRVVAGIGAFILLMAAALIIFAATFDVNKYRGTIQSQLEKRLGRAVTLGDMHLKVWPPSFRVQNPAINDDTHFSADAPFIKAQELDVSVKFAPLLHKQIEMSSLDLQRPVVNLIKNSAGVWNFASLGHPSQSAEPASPTQPTRNPSPQTPASQPSPQSAPQATQPPSGSEQLSLGKLTISNGQLSILDQTKSKTPSLYDHIDVNPEDFSLNEPFTIDAAAHISGSGSQEVRLQGKGGPVVSGRPETTPFHGTLNLKQITINDLSKFLNSPALNGTDGILSGETRIDSESGKVTAKGQTQIQNGKVRGMELGFPVTAEYDLTDDLSADLLAMRNLIVKLGATPVQMSGTVNAKPTPALVDLNVKANNVSMFRLQKQRN